MRCHRLVKEAAFSSRNICAMNTLGDGEVVRSTRCRDPDEAAQAIHGVELETDIVSFSIGVRWDFGTR
jgi:hypothetical protein